MELEEEEKSASQHWSLGTIVCWPQENTGWKYINKPILTFCLCVSSAKTQKGSLNIEARFLLATENDYHQGFLNLLALTT